MAGPSRSGRKRFNMSKIALITGITGMDGEALADILLAKGYVVVGTYRKTASFSLDALRSAHRNHPNLYLEYCDITDNQSVKALLVSTIRQHGSIDEVYLLAAQSHVGLSFTTAESTVWANGISVFYFLENLRMLCSTARVYFAATSELLGGDPRNCPFTEASPYECRSPYAIGKELGVRWVNYFRMTYGMYATYGVLFNHSNTSRNLSFFIRRVTNGAARIALGKQNTLSLGNLDFYRDEHWSDFGCEMMWRMLQLDAPEVFLICRGQCLHGEEFLDAAFGHFNLNWRNYVTFDPEKVRANEVVKLVGDPSLAEAKLGWNPDRMPFQSHIALMCAHDYAIEKGEHPARPDVFALFPETKDERIAA